MWVGLPLSESQQMPAGATPVTTGWPLSTPLPLYSRTGQFPPKDTKFICVRMISPLVHKNNFINPVSEDPHPSAPTPSKGWSWVRARAGVEMSPISTQKPGERKWGCANRSPEEGEVGKRVLDQDDS